MILELNIEFFQKKPERQEIFNLKNKKYQEIFRKETEQNIQLLKCFENENSLEYQAKSWYKTFDSILHRCFKKVRISENKKINQKSLLIKERINLKTKVKSTLIEEETKVKFNQRIKEIEDKIGEEIAETFQREIVETIKDLGGDGTNIDGSGRKKMWDLLKKKIPKVKSAFPVGKKDFKGNIITNHIGLKKLYLKTYKERLRNRPIKNNFEELKKLKTTLFNLRTIVCRDMEHLEAAIKTL